MEISEIKIFPVNGTSKMKAKANVEFVLKNGGKAVIKAFRILDDGVKPAWVGCPCERITRNGKDEYIDGIWLDDLAKASIMPAILSEYSKIFKKN
ncbi:MAG: hypothetical protein K2X47_11710 [Bdellovibrionales bacterium]|nr:hypothetical protein [Bdellovibrionales bacterium]